MYHSRRKIDYSSQNGIFEKKYSMYMFRIISKLLEKARLALMRRMSWMGKNFTSIDNLDNLIFHRVE